MCKRCDKINEQLRRYARLRHVLFDREIRDEADALVEQLRAELGILHPPPVFH